jgi:voltage-gated potassium channel Kch
VLIANHALSSEVIEAAEGVLREINRSCEAFGLRGSNKLLPKARIDCASTVDANAEGAGGQLLERVMYCTNFCDISYPPAPATTQQERCGAAIPGRTLDEDARFGALPVAPHQALLQNSLGTISRVAVGITTPKVLRALLLLLLGVSLLASLVPSIGDVAKAELGFDQFVRVIVASRRDWASLLCKAVAFHAAIAILIWLSEFHEQALKSNTDFLKGGIWGAFRWMFSFIILGSTNVELHSTLAVMWVGLLKAGWAIASLALSVGLVQTFARWLRIKRMSNHVIIVGSNEHERLVIDELNAQRLPYRRFWGAPEPSSPLLKSVATDSELEHVDSFVPRARAAELLRARAVLVLTDDERAQEEKAGDADAWVCRQVLKLRAAEALILSECTTLERARSTRRVRIVAQVGHQQNAALASAAGADDTICVSKLGTLLLGQLATKAGLNEVYEDLLSTKPNTQELYFDVLSDAEVATFRTFQRILNAQSKEPSAYRRIPIGVRRRSSTQANGYNILLNPQGNEGRLCRGDELIVIGQMTQKSRVFGLASLGFATDAKTDT